MSTTDQPAGAPASPTPPTSSPSQSSSNRLQPLSPGPLVSVRRLATSQQTSPTSPPPPRVSVRIGGKEVSEAEALEAIWGALNKAPPGGPSLADQLWERLDEQDKAIEQLQKIFIDQVVPLLREIKTALGR